MAITFTYADVLSLIAKTLPKTWEDTYSATACNLATNLIWEGYDWRESLVTLPPFYLIPNEQDHKLPAVTVPADFLGLRKVGLTQYANGAAASRPISLVKDLEITAAKGIPHSISYEPTISAFRLFPRVPGNIGSPNWFIQGTYKKKPTLITNDTLETLLPFDDKYVYVMMECVRWALLFLGNSPAAGKAQASGGVIFYDGQLANAISAIERMATDQGVNDGDVRISPSEALVYGLGQQYGYPGLFQLLG